MAFDRFCLMVSLEKLAAVELSTHMGVGGCGRSSFYKVAQMRINSCLLMKVAPISASAADAMTWLMILETVWMGPLSRVMVAGGC